MFRGYRYLGCAFSSCEAPAHRVRLEDRAQDLACDPPSNLDAILLASTLRYNPCACLASNHQLDLDDQHPNQRSTSCWHGHSSRKCTVHYGLISVHSRFISPQALRPPPSQAAHTNAAHVSICASFYRRGDVPKISALPDACDTGQDYLGCLKEIGTLSRSARPTRGRDVSNGSGTKFR